MRRRTGWIVAGSILVVAALAIAIPLTLDFQIENRMRSVANKFVAEPGWRLSSETASDHYQCSGIGVPCDSLGRFYNLDAHLSKDEFQSKLRGAGWDFSITGDCEPRPTSYDTITLCSAEGTADGFDIRISLTGTADSDYLTLAMNKVA